MHHYIGSNHGDLEITLGHDSITLVGVAKNDLHAGDFIF
jgi:hypothetical protein